jgi:SAM-dependent methyltransferase
MSASPDPDGLLYAEHWEPVLAAAAGRMLERVAVRLRPLGARGAGVAQDAPGPSGAQGAQGAPGAEPRLVLDVGAGTGSLTLAAAERWPAATIVGLDASAGMLSVARHRAESRWPGHDDRFRWLAADAAEMPLDADSVDLAVSSFVLQLVEDRRAVLREIGRVLRPGGVLGFVTWRRADDWLAPDEEFDEAVYDLDLDEPEADARDPAEREYESPEEAAADLRAEGFTDIEVATDSLVFAWRRAEYRAFKERYDERDLFDSLSDADRTRLLERVDERWAALPDDAFVLRAPLVSATARRTG